MTTWLSALNEAWDELAQTAPISREYRSRLISRDTSLEILAGMRAADDAPCLMLQADIAHEALFELSGMRLTTAFDDKGAFLILILEDSRRRDLFATICADVIGTAAIFDKNEALACFLSRLAAWRQFLRDRHDGLSQAETIGLIGELLVLERLLEADPHCLTSWQSPNDGLHDFQTEGHALEVKTGLGPASRITISRLDQLDDNGVRRLELLHVRLIESPGGRSLRDLIASVGAILPDDTGRRAFENSLLRCGLLPDDDAARSAPRVQLRAMDAYAVAAGFPRLIRSNVPIPIAEATYTLEVRALSTFALETGAVLDTFRRGGNS